MVEIQIENIGCEIIPLNTGIKNIWIYLFFYRGIERKVGKNTYDQGTGPDQNLQK